jgi:hypothetical protein
MEITLEVLTDANTDATGDYPLEQASFSEHVRPPGANPHGPGHRVVFSDNLLLKKVDPQDPGPPAKPVFELGKGLPKPKEPEKRRVGTQSGFVTTIRFVMAGDDFLPAGTGLFQYEGTYRLNAFTHAGTTVLKAGQITARGVALLGADFKPFPPGGVSTFAVVGGTGAYANARGQITESGDIRTIRLLDPPLDPPLPL